MHYDFIAIAEAEISQAVEPVFQHVVTYYVSEANRTVTVWRAVPDDLLDFKPHEKTNPSGASLLNLSAPRSRPSRNCFRLAISQSLRPTSRTTSGSRSGELTNSTP